MTFATFGRAGISGQPGPAPVVFLHGYLESPAIWSDALALCDRNAVPAVALPLPGHHPSALDVLAVQRAVQDDLITDLVSKDIERVFPDRPVRIVGHSTGGLLALRLAARCPTPISQLMLVGALRQAERGLLRRMLVTALERRRLGSALSRMLVRGWLAHPALFRAGIASVCVSSPKTSLDVMKADLDQSDPVALRYMLLWLMRQNIDGAELSRVVQPVVSVLGTGDRVVPPHHQIDLTARLPNASAVLLESGHLPMVECPKTFLRIVDAWLSEPTA